MPARRQAKRGRSTASAPQVLEAWLEHAQAQHTLNQAWAGNEDAGGDAAWEAKVDELQDQAARAWLNVADLLVQAHAAGRFQALVGQVLALAEEGGARTHPFPPEAVFDLRADLARAHDLMYQPTGKAGQQASVALVGVAITGLLDEVEALARDARFVETLLATQVLGGSQQARMLGVLPAGQAAALACDPAWSWDLALALGKHWEGALPDLGAQPDKQAGVERFGGYVVVVAARHLLDDDDEDLETDWDGALEAWEEGVDTLKQSMGGTAVVDPPTELALAAWEAWAGQLTHQLFLDWGTVHAQAPWPDLAELAWVVGKGGRVDLVGRFEDGTLQCLRGALEGQAALLRDRIGAFFDFPVQVLEDADALARWEAEGGEMGSQLPGFVASHRPPAHRLH